MTTFSANLGFLWTDRPLPDAIRAAASAGFDAVECHMPYDVPAADVAAALRETGRSMISLNTRIGDREGDLGVAALPGREAEAKTYIDEAIAYAVAIDCDRISVVAGRSGRTEAAEQTYRANLGYAAEQAARHDKIILIEPLNTNVAEDYHLLSVDAGVATIEAVGVANLKLMVDCFHTQTTLATWTTSGTYKSRPTRTEGSRTVVTSTIERYSLRSRRWAGTVRSVPNTRPGPKSMMAWCGCGHGENKRMTQQDRAECPSEQRCSGNRRRSWHRPSGRHHP